MEIREIKRRLPLVDVLTRYGLRPDASGRMHCPFHEDKTPSFQVYHDTREWHCFAASCQDDPHGDVIDFIRKQESCSVGEAIAQAKAWAGAPSGDGLPAEAAPAVDLETRRFVMDRLFARFRRSLSSSKRARAYLEARGLDPDEMLRLGAGYNSGRWVNHLMDPSGKETQALLEEATALGLILPDGKAFARGCIVLPLVDDEGQTLSLYGRSLSEGKARHFYLRQRQGLFPAYPPRDTRVLVLTEAPLDAATLVLCGVPEAHAVLALYGTNGFTEEHRAAIERLVQLEELVLFFDGDTAGQQATGALAPVLRALCPGAVVSRVLAPDGEDVNSLWLAGGRTRITALIEAREVLSSPETPAAADYTLETSDAEVIVFRAALAPALTVSILGGVKLHDLARLRVTLRLDRRGYGSAAGTFRCPLDLYQPKQRRRLIEEAAEELALGREALKSVVSLLVSALEKYRFEAREREARQGRPTAPVVSEGDRAEALRYLKAPDLLEQTALDIGRSGVVGEAANRMLMYLAFTTRLREKPLQVLCLGESGTGKTHLQEAVARLIPEEEVIEATAFSEMALYYFQEQALKHKLLVVEDLDGAEGVLYALRELQSKGRLSRQVPLKNERGQIITRALRVEGPVCVTGCTTKERLLVDNETRALVLYLDESAEQSRRILAYQQRLSSGQIDTAEQERVRGLLKNVQRLLRPVGVVNPFAEHLRLPPEVLRPRRAGQLYLALVEAVTFYRQYQRRHEKQHGREVVLTDLADIEAANQLALPVLATKSDELTGTQRRVLERLRQHVGEAGSFLASEARAALRLSPSTMHRHLAALRGYGFVERLGGSRYRRGYEYRLTGESGDPHASVERFLAEQLAQLKQEQEGSGGG